MIVLVVYADIAHTSNSYHCNVFLAASQTQIRYDGGYVITAKDEGGF